MKRRKSLITFLTFVLIILTTFSYSALSTRFQVIIDVQFRADANIRITDILLDSTSNGGLISFDSNYTKNTITSGFKLPNLNSTVSYNVTITNKGNIDQAIYNITTISSSNNNIYYLIDDKPINEVLPMIVPLGTSKTIKITYKTTSPFSNTETIVNNFEFKKVYYVDYNLKGGSYTNDQNDLKNGQIKYEDVPLTLTNEKPTKSKYVFIGWTDEQNGTTVKYQSGSTYTLNENKIMYAVWKTGEATFIDGPSFNIKIKQLANPSVDNIDVNYNDTNITSIVRANSLPNGFTPTEANIVSTSNSDIPIYAWYDNHTLYYYTLADNPYMNAVASRMFNHLSNVTSIALDTINTSRTTNMSYLFSYNSYLSSLDLSTFNTNNVTNMSSLLNSCTSLTELDLSKINMSNVTSTAYMMYNMTSLRQLKTPKTYPNSAVIDLPTTLYDISGNAYTSINSSSPTETWLKKEYGIYTITYDLNGGTVSTPNPTSYNVDSSPITLNNPTKEGYTFSGWSGKNLLNSNVTESYPSSTNLENTTKRTFTPNTYVVGLAYNNYFYPNNINRNSINITDNSVTFNGTNGYGLAYPLMLTAGETYTLSYNATSNSESGVPHVNIQFYLEDGTRIGNSDNLNNTGFNQIVFEVPSNTYYSVITLCADSSSNLTYTFSNVQIEKGNSYTAYEQYRNKQLNVTIPTGSTGNKSYVANYTANTYNVVFDKNDTNATGTMSNQNMVYDVNSNLNINTFINPSYIFVGWNTKADGTGIAYLDGASVKNLTSINNGTITLYAQWDKVPYTVTFNTNGGSINKFEGNELYINPAGVDSYSISNNVYTVTTSEAYPSIMLPLDIFTNGKTYTLKYKFKKNSGTLYTLGGHCQSTSKIYLKVDGQTTSSSYNQIYMSDDNLIHEIEYKFVFYSGNGGVYIQPNRGNGSLINYDLWDIEVIEDNYVATKTVYYDSTYGTLPTPVREGYTFKGWNGKNIFNYEEILKNNSSTVSYEEFNDAQTISWINSSNTNTQKFLQGYFKDNTQYIFHGNVASSKSNRIAFDIYYKDGSNQIFDFSSTNHVSSAPANTFYDISFVSSYGKTIDFIRGAWSAEERVFVDINSFIIEEGDTATPYEPYYVTSGTNVTQAKDHTLTAIWEVNNYEIVFDKNSNDATGTMSNLSMTYDESKVLTTNAFTRTGYTFVGWNTKADGTGTAYLDGASVSNLASSGTVTLYAQWAVISYIVTLDSNEGNIIDNVNLLSYEVTMERNNDQYIVSGTAITAGLYVPSEAFEGWKTYILRFKIQKVDGSLTALGGHLVHTQIYFKIDGSNSSSRYTDYYSTTNNIPNDTNVHTVELKFTYNGSTSGIDSNIYIQPNRAKTDYFKVKIFDVELEELSTTKTVNFGGTYGTLPTPTTPGYQFAGWNGKNLFEVGTLDDYYIYYQSGMNVSISNNKISSTILEEQMAFIRNEKHTYTAGNYVFKYQSSNGNKRHLIFPYDENGNILTDSDISISGWTYNQSYGGWFSNLLDSEYSTVVIPEEVSYWKYGIVFTGAISEFGDTLEVSNIMIEEGVESTPYEPYFVTSSTPLTRNEDHTLYAKWTPNTYSIVFDKNDNAATGTMNNQSMNYGTSSNLTNNSYYKRGFKFVGWNTASDGTGTAYLNGASVSKLTNVNNGTITLYAQWEKLMAEDVGHTIQDLNCEDVQCVIDELYYMLY